MEFKTTIEPFKIKTVEPIRWTSKEQRAQLRRGVGAAGAEEGRNKRDEAL